MRQNKALSRINITKMIKGTKNFSAYQNKEKGFIVQVWVAM